MAFDVFYRQNIKDIFHFGTRYFLKIAQNENISRIELSQVRL